MRSAPLRRQAAAACLPACHRGPQLVEGMDVNLIVSIEKLNGLFHRVRAPTLTVSRMSDQLGSSSITPSQERRRWLEGLFSEEYLQLWCGQISSSLKV